MKLNELMNLLHKLKHEGKLPKELDTIEIRDFIETWIPKPKMDFTRMI